MNMSKRTRLIIKWALVIIWMIAIFMLSNEVANVSSARSAVIVNTVVNSFHVSLSSDIITFLTRKAAHIFMYFVLGILMYNVVRDHKITTKQAILFSILFTLSYAISDEIHQLFVQGRSCEIRDVIIDTVAGTVGIGVYYLLYRVRNDHLIKKALNNKKRLLKWSYRAVGIALALSYVVAVYAVNHTHMVPTKYLMVAVPVVGLAVALLVFAQFKEKLSCKKGLIVVILSILMIAANLYVYTVSNDIIGFLNTIQQSSKNSNIKVNTAKTDMIKPFVLYISGIDTYGDVATVSRSDVNILVVVNPQTHKILLINTPRDYYVQLHGTTGIRDKLTHAGIYGIDMSVKTMEDLYSTPIDYYLRINFSSLTNIVDVINGVDVYSDYNFTADGNHFTQGYNQLNGTQALAFSRDRHSFEGGDRIRGENQQRVIEAIITKLNNPATLLNYRQIILSLSGTIQTSMGVNDMTTLIKNQLDSMSKWSVESISVNGTDSHNSTYSMGNVLLYVMEPDAESLNNAIQKIRQYQVK